MGVKVRLELFREQAAFMEDRAAFVAGRSGGGGGKTRGGGLKLLKDLVDHPGALGIVTAPTFPMLRDATLRTMLEMWPKEAIRGFNKAEMQLTLMNGSEALLRSTENPDHLYGPNAACFWMDEGSYSPLEAFKILQGRLRQAGYPGQGWLTYKSKGYDWTYFEFKNREIANANYSYHEWSARRNIFLPPEFLQRLEESYSSEYAMQEIEGQYAITSGLGYFDRKATGGFLKDCSEPETVRRGGMVRIWRAPVVGARYLAGMDTAWGETGSFSCVYIMDWQTGLQVAELHGRPKPDELGQEAFNLLTEYNRAYLVPEWAGDEEQGQLAIRKLMTLGYSDRMYFRDGAKRKEPGWVTNERTRPLMLAELEEAVRKREVAPRCKDCVDELMAFIRDEKGRPTHAEGMRDDHVFALALAWQARNHARSETETIRVEYHDGGMKRHEGRPWRRTLARSR